MAEKKQTNMLKFFGGGESNDPGPFKKAKTDSPSNSATAETSVSSSKSSTGTKTKSRSFRNEWFAEFKWLRFESEAMFCRICEEACKNNGFTKGCVNMQKSALQEHRESMSHRDAVFILTNKKAMNVHVAAAKEKDDDALTCMMRTVLFMAKQNIPSDKFVPLVQLQKKNGCKNLSGVVYTHGDSVEEMENALAEATIETLKERISKSKFIGLIIDETVNVTVEKKLIIFIRIENGGKCETVFLGNYTVHGGTAEIITDKIREVMAEWNIPLEKITGFGSDGASVMTGVRSGVGVRLRDSNCQYLVHVHCIAHRVALASQDAARLSKCVAEYRTTLNDVYKLYQYSATRYDRLKELSKVLDDTEFSSLKQPCTVRWLSLGRAVKSTKLNLPALIIELEEEAAQRNNTAAKGLVKKLKTYAFFSMTYTLSDVLPYMEKLVTIFQRDQLNLAMIQPMVQSTITCLNGLLTQFGENEVYLSENISEGEFRGIKLTYADPGSVAAAKKKRDGFITDLIDSLNKRFPEDSLTVLHSLDKVLNPFTYPKTPEEMNAHARESLDVILDHFSPVIGQADNDVRASLIDRDRTRRDFQQMKQAMSGFGASSFDQACQILINEYQDIFPDFATLAAVAITIPVSSVPAERGFSVQNRIHTAARNRLSHNRINNLMLLNMHSNDTEESQFNFQTAIKMFRKKKRKL